MMSCQVRRNCPPMLKVLRPLLHSQLLTTTTPSLRLSFLVNPPLQHSLYSPGTPHEVGAFWPSNATSGNVVPPPTPANFTFILALFWSVRYPIQSAPAVTTKLDDTVFT